MNNIQIAELFTNLVDEKYKATSLSAVFEGNGVEIGHNHGKFKVMKVDVDGIGTYDKSEGYAEGATTVDWEEVTPDIDLSGKIVVDHYDNEETLIKAFSKGSEALLQKLVKEVDAIRFAKIASIAKHKKEETLETGEDVVKSIRNMINFMNNQRVYNDKYLIGRPEIFGAIEDMDSYRSKQVLGNFIGRIEVPEDVFQTAVEIFTGRGENKKFNYAKAAGASDINYMIVSKASILAGIENRFKWINAEVNQNLDADVFALRTYGLSAYGYDNKVDGIYVSYAPAN